MTLAACGGDTQRADAGRALAGPALPFTFRYPSTFRADTADRDGVLATVALDARDAIAVRQTSDRALDPDQYLGSLRASFARQGLNVAGRREDHAGRRMGVLSLTIPAGHPGAGGRGPLRTTSYFFTAAGRTWQVECRSARRAAEVRRACATALRSLDVH